MNSLNTYQQVILHLAPIFTSPIWMNGILVFVRLRYFEWRFKGISHKAKIQSQARRMTFAETINPASLNVFQRAMTRTTSNRRATMDDSAGSSQSHNNSASDEFNSQSFSNVFSQRHPDNAVKYRSKFPKRSTSEDPGPPPRKLTATKFATDDDIQGPSTHFAASSSTANTSKTHFPENLPSHAMERAADPLDKYPDHNQAQPADLVHSINMMEQRLARHPRHDLEDSEAFVVPSLVEQEEGERLATSPNNPLTTPRPRTTSHGILKMTSNAESLEPSDSRQERAGLHPKFQASAGAPAPNAHSQNRHIVDSQNPDLERGLHTAPHGSRMSFWSGARRSKVANDEHTEEEEQIRILSWRRKQEAAAAAAISPLQRLLRALRFWKWFGKRPTGGPKVRRRGPKTHWWQLPWIFGPSKENFSNYLQWSPTIQGNSVFVELTSEQKEEMGGIEYRALKMLAKVLVGYYLGWNLVSAFLIAPWAQVTKTYSNVFESNAVNRVWWGIFLAQSAFNNVGLTLTPDSLISFVGARYLLTISTFVMIIGYSGFPCMLRLMLWIMQQLSDPRRELHESVTFLLEHPRRCFTLLFPSGPTWWLFFVIIILNGIDLFLYVVLDLSNKNFDHLDASNFVTSGIFQSAATRTSGLGVVDLNTLHPAVVVSYTIMMYISVYPITMSLRNTNVYEEKSLGVYRVQDEDGSSSSESESEEFDSDGSFEMEESSTEDSSSSSEDEPEDETDSDETARQAGASGADTPRTTPSSLYQKLTHRRKGAKKATGSRADSATKSTIKRRLRLERESKPTPLPHFGIPGLSTSWGSHIQRQLSFDMWFLFIAFFLLCVVEGGKIGLLQVEGKIPLFNVIFEVVSAYCTVGLSMGYPNTNPALSAQFSRLGKLIICLCLWRGRHRGLPYAVDRAVLLPSDLEEHDKDQEMRVNAAKTFAAISGGLPAPDTGNGGPNSGMSSSRRGSALPRGATITFVGRRSSAASGRRRSTRRRVTSFPETRVSDAAASATFKKAPMKRAQSEVAGKFVHSPFKNPWKHSRDEHAQGQAQEHHLPHLFGHHEHPHAAAGDLGTITMAAPPPTNGSGILQHSGDGGGPLQQPAVESSILQHPRDNSLGEGPPRPAS